MVYFFKNILFFPLFATEFSQKMKPFFITSINSFPKNEKNIFKKIFFSQKMRFSLRKNEFFIKHEVKHYLGAGRFTKETKSMMVAKNAGGLQRLIKLKYISPLFKHLYEFVFL